MSTVLQLSSMQSVDSMIRRRDLRSAVVQAAVSLVDAIDHDDSDSVWYAAMVSDAEHRLCVAVEAMRDA